MIGVGLAEVAELVEGGLALGVLCRRGGGRGWRRVVFVVGFGMGVGGVADVEEGAVFGLGGGAVVVLGLVDDGLWRGS